MGNPKTKVLGPPPSMLNLMIADLAINATGPGLVTVRMHGRETTTKTDDLRKQMRLAQKALTWLIAAAEATCVAADALPKMKRTPTRKARPRV